MANMTLSIPDDLHAKMKGRPDISWSEVARQAIAQRMEREERFEEMLRQAKEEEQLPEELWELDRRIKERMWKRTVSEYNRRHKHPLGGAAAARDDKRTASAPAHKAIRTTSAARRDTRARR